MKQILLVFLGGGLGSALRYLLSKVFYGYFEHFYLGTFIVNVVGCLLIGLLLGLSLKENLISQNHTLLLVTGFCGGFTTFSTFAFENHSIIRDAGLFHFALYTITSIGIGIAAVVLGLWLSKI